MQITTIIARDSRAALEEITRQLGPDALVLETRQHSRGVEIVAAVEGYVPPRKTEPSPGGVAAFAEQAEAIGVTPRLVDRIGRDVADATEAWTRFLVLLDAEVPIAEAPHRGAQNICVVGGSGTGKTTVLAQIAARLRRDDPVAKIAFLAADSARIGAREQLRLIGAQLDIGVFDLPEAARLADSGVRLLIDSPSDPFAARQVADVLRGLIGGLHTICTMPLTAQLARHRQMLGHFEGVADSAVVTHAGETLPPGALISALVEARQPLAYLSHDADPRGSIEIARPSALYRLIVAALSGASGTLQ